jgi:rhodanese-related sulfurtransferase
VNLSRPHAANQSVHREGNMDKAITPEGLKKLKQEKKDVIILDVRRKSDYESDSQTIPGAQWHDPEKVAEWSKTLPKDKDIVVYCVRGGSVSQAVAGALLEKNLNAKYVEGGVSAWKESGGEVED